MTEFGSELSAEEKAAIEAAIKDAEEAIRENDVEAIKAKNEALATAAQKLGEKVYAKQQAETAAASGAGDSGAGSASGHSEAKKDEGDVVDAEYTEVKDKKSE